MKFNMQCFACGQRLLLDTGQCSCDNRNESGVFYNAVLAYCQAYMQKYDVNTMAKAVDTYFACEDVNTARKLMRQFFPEQLADLDIMKHETRRNTAQRPVNMINAQDITEAVYKLCNMDIGPMFVTHEIQKLPIMQPDIVDPRSQMERLALLEKKFERLDEWRVNKDKALDKLTPLPASTSRYSDVARPRNPIGSRTLLSDHGQVRPNGSLEASSSTPPNIANIGETASNAMEMEPLPSANSNNNIDGGGWLTVGPRTNRSNQYSRHSGQQGNNKKRSPGIQGKAAGTSITAGGGPNRDLWVYNVGKEMQDDFLKDFIENGGSKKAKKVTIRHWEGHYKEHWDTKSFHLTIPLADYETVYSEDFWPEDIWIRKYWVNKKRDNTNSKVTAQSDRPASDSNTPSSE